MGNDIKLSASQRKELSESQRTSEAEARTQLNYEIEKITNQVTSINNQIDRIEYSLKETSRNIEYYQKLITDMSRTLYQIQMEQVNADLTHENYVERAKWFLDSLKDFSEEPERDTEAEDYSPATIANYQQNVASLQNEVAVNDKVIDQKMKDISE